MNQERLLKIIEDMQECIADINEWHFLKYNSNFDDIVKIAKLYVR